MTPDLCDFRIDCAFNEEHSTYQLRISVWDGDEFVASKTYEDPDVFVMLNLSKAFLLAWSASVYGIEHFIPRKHDDDGNEQLALPF
jgi:hypothetical protein